MMALYFYFNETTGDLVYSDKATYGKEGYTSLGQQTDTAPILWNSWVFNSQRSNIKTFTPDPDISAPIDVLTSMAWMFYTCNNITLLDLSGFDTSKVTDMNSMFSHFRSHVPLNLGYLNTSNVTNMSTMFNYCQGPTYIDLNGFDTSSVTNMWGMFQSCRYVDSIDLSSFDTSNVTNMDSMFSNFRAISLDLSSFDTSNVTDTSNMFLGYSPRVVEISPNMSNVLSELYYDTYYDAFTRQAYAKNDIPGGSTYVYDLTDLDLVAPAVNIRAGIKAMEHRVNSHIDELQRQLDALTA